MMKPKQLLVGMLVGTTVLFSCSKDEDAPTPIVPTPTPNPVTMQSFTVTIENNQTPYDYFSSGVFNTPTGATMPSGAGPGNSYQFTVNAGPGSKLSFATMFVGSNDLFFAPNGNGISLFSGNTPVTGDVTSQISLWDAGTEVNQMPGSGSNQPANQSGPNTGMAENGTVRNITNVMDGYTYPTVASTIKVTLTTGSNVNEFIVNIENLVGSTTPIAPGVWVVHTATNPLFVENSVDLGNGLEALAEDGDPSILGSFTSSKSGLNTPFAPGVWAIHSAGNPMFSTGTNATAGLEKLAEDGDPSMIFTELSSNTIVSQTAVFNTPDGASAPGALTFGGKYIFTFTANQGDYLSLGTMFIQSNDLFYSFGQGGLNLWNGNFPISGDVTAQLDLWDSGTEVNEYPGVGLNQAPRQVAANTGINEGGTVNIVNDGFIYLSNTSNIKVTISLN